jgi:hypothetical protein
MTFHRCYLQNFSSFGKAVSGKKIFRNRAIWNKNCLWQPCLQTNRDEMSNLYRGPSIDASYQVSVHLVKWFQRRRFLELLSQMNWNFVGSIYGRSSIIIAHFVPIRNQTWSPQAILVSDWLISKKIFSSESAWPNEPKLAGKHLWKAGTKWAIFIEDLP